jgi:hypothetical protein
MAVLRVPKIGLEVPLLEGTDDLTLNHTSAGLRAQRGQARQATSASPVIATVFFEDLRM